MNAAGVLATVLATVALFLFGVVVRDVEAWRMLGMIATLALVIGGVRLVKAP